MAALGLIASWWAVALPARRHAGELRVRRYRDVRYLLHAQLAGLRPDLACDRAAVFVSGVFYRSRCTRAGFAPCQVTPLYPRRRPPTRPRHGSDRPVLLVTRATSAFLARSAWRRVPTARAVCCFRRGSSPGPGVAGRRAVARAGAGRRTDEGSSLRTEGLHPGLPRPSPGRSGA